MERRRIKNKMSFKDYIINKEQTLTESYKDVMKSIQGLNLAIDKAIERKDKKTLDTLVKDLQSILDSLK